MMLKVKWPQRTMAATPRARILLWPLAALVIVYFLLSGLKRRISGYSASGLVQKHIDYRAGIGGRKSAP